jgi:DNA-directed RNA polymerase subunit RPC12/RpoP
MDYYNNSEEFDQMLGEMINCPTCSGDSYLMGYLGQSTYYRCENCGIEFTINYKQEVDNG